MSSPPIFYPLQFEFIKDAIPFELDTAESEDDADSEIDFSIANVDEYAEYEEELKR